MFIYFLLYPQKTKCSCRDDSKNIYNMMPKMYRTYGILLYRKINPGWPNVALNPQSPCLLWPMRSGCPDATTNDTPASSHVTLYAVPETAGYTGRVY
jgi:hypothetical protein